MVETKQNRRLTEFAFTFLLFFPSPFQMLCMRKESNFKFVLRHGIPFGNSYVASCMPCVLFLISSVRFSGIMCVLGKRRSIKSSPWKHTRVSLLSIVTGPAVHTFVRLLSGDFDLYIQELQQALTQIGVPKVGIGFETVNPNNGKPYSDGVERGKKRSECVISEVFFFVFRRKLQWKFSSDSSCFVRWIRCNTRHTCGQRQFPRTGQRCCHGRVLGSCVC